VSKWFASLSPIILPPSAASDPIDLTAPRLDDDPTAAEQGRRFPHYCSVPSDLTVDTDTDSIGQQTLDEFADAQEESRDDHPHEEGEESNSTTGECLFLTSFPLTLTPPLDQSNELIPDADQFGDGFNWDEDFGGDFDDGEFGEFEDQSNVEEKRVDSQEPTSGRSSKRGFDEIDSDTADEEGTTGDVSPSTLLFTPCAFSETHADSVQIQNGRRCCSLSLCWTDTVQVHVAPAPISFFSLSVTPSFNNRPKVKYLSVLAS